MSASLAPAPSWKTPPGTAERQRKKVLNAFLREVRDPQFPVKPRKDLTLRQFLDDKMLVMAAIRSGIPYSLFAAIALNTPFSENEWAEFLDISTKSLQRFKTAEGYVFKRIHSEKILEVAEVTQAGLDLWGDMEKFRLWLQTPNFALGGLRPITLIADSYGKELVMAELVRISYGILS